MAVNLSLTIFYGFSIRGDSTPKEKMPRDGTVFQLTSNVILFLQQINEFVDTLAMILTQDTSYNQVCGKNERFYLTLLSFLFMIEKYFGIYLVEIQWKMHSILNDLREILVIYCFSFKNETGGKLKELALLSIFNLYTHPCKILDIIAFTKKNQC